jgi:1-acyl-sn-glycerol-3-phosphate acyltransferase
MSHPNQFSLLGQRRFAPFFWVQFLGAGNDNVFKFAFTVMVTYQLQLSWLPPAQAGLVIGALFILPFLLFSATSGQLADKYPKEVLIRFVKTLEIAIMAVAAWGFARQDVPLLLACVFLMGLHSTLFGPVKFAYLPQHLDERELTGGNGMVEMGTFVAILLGNVAGGLLVAVPQVGPQYVAVACLLLAVLGRLVAQAIPASPPTDPGLAINWNPFTETWRNLRLAHGNVVVFRSLLGISWMWFFGAVFLSQFPVFARQVLHGNEQVASLLLVVFSIGVGTGALLCEMLSRRHVEIGLVPLGAIGMTVFSVDLYFATRALEPYGDDSLAGFLAQPEHWRVLFDLAMLAVFAGLFSVPMYALIQTRSPITHLARVNAANNVLNAMFMVASAAVVASLLALGLTLPQVFLAVGVANALVAAYVFLMVPEYLLRFVAWVASRIVYRFRVRGDEHVPASGPAVLVCNHVSFVDAVLLMAASPRPIRFVMDHRIFALPVLGTMFRLSGAIPIAPRSVDSATYERAFEQARRVLDEGELLGIFPEGAITRDGRLQPFRAGVRKLLDTHPVPVLPMALGELWGSYFSRIEQGRAMVRPFRRGAFTRVRLEIGEPMPAHEATPEALQHRVQALLDRGPTRRPA